MNQLCRNFALIFLSLSAVSVFGMESQPKAVASFTFTQALMKADMGFGIDWLEQFVEGGQGLNTLHDQMYPLAHIIAGRYDSSLITKAILHGARVDFSSQQTLFHWIARAPKTGQPHESAYFPKKNLLSALALPTYQYPHKRVIIERVELVRKGEFQALKASVKTFLLCMNKPEYCQLKQVRFVILGHFIGKHFRDGIYCQGMFNRTVDYIKDLKGLVAQSPTEWFCAVAQRRPGEEKDKFIKKFAPHIARYRLEQAQEVLKARDNYLDSTAYEIAQQINESRVSDEEENNFKEAIKGVRDMVEDLNPEGFIDRHMPDCTKIVTNMLENKDPFFGFEFK